MRSTLQSSRKSSSWLQAILYGLFALAVATSFAQSALAQAPAASTEPTGAKPAAIEPATAADRTEPLATTVQGDDSVTKRALDIDSSILMREQDRRMVDHFLLAIAVFFAVIAFLLFVSLPPRKPGEN